MRAEVEGGQGHSGLHTPQSNNASANLSRTRSPRPEPYTDVRPKPDGEDEDHQRQWAQEEQQMMMQEQDRTMDTISGTLNTLAQQAGLMGREIVEHNEYVYMSFATSTWC